MLSVSAARTPVSFTNALKIEGFPHKGLRVMQELILQDPEIAEAIFKESRRQTGKLELIASENFVSAAVREAQGSILTHK